MIKLNGHVIEPTIFPDGTSQVWKIEEYIQKPGHHCMPVQRVEWWFENEAEFMHLAQLKTLLGRQNAELYMPYCPYARQDKTACSGGTFALYPFLRILEGMKWSEIRTIDMHNVQPVIDYGYFNWMNNNKAPIVSHYDTVIFPDAGAARRYDIKHPNIVIGHKVRDQETGWITHYELEGNVHGNCIVVDDLCDGGLTFELLAKSISKFHLKRLDLSVTHGIFSKGLSKLLNWYDTIFTTNSFFGHTIRSQTMMDDLERAADVTVDHQGFPHKIAKRAWYAEMWQAVQRQQLVIEAV